MKIVILDGYTANPGDLSWKELEDMGSLTVYERTRPEETVARAAKGRQSATETAERLHHPSHRLGHQRGSHPTVAGCHQQCQGIPGRQAPEHRIRRKENR